MWGHEFSLSIKVAGRLLPFCWIRMKLQLPPNLSSFKLNSCQTLKHMHVWVAFLHLVCEPDMFNESLSPELWHFNKQHVWCVCLIISQLSWVEVLLVNTNKGRWNHKEIELIHYSLNLCLQPFKAEGGKLFTESALDVMNNVALQWFAGTLCTIPLIGFNNLASL